MTRKTNNWPKRDVLVSKLRFDTKNPRLQFEVEDSLTQKQLYDLLLKDFDAIELAEQMESDYFYNSEILIVIKEGDTFVVLDGNRRLAAFRHAQKMKLPSNGRSTLPVTIAPSREEADKEIIVKHVGNLKKNWTTPNQLNKLREIVDRSSDKTIKEIVKKYPSLGTEKTVKRRLLNLEIYELLLKSDWLISDEKSRIVKRGVNIIERFYTSSPGEKYFSLSDLPYPFEKEKLQKIINLPESQRIVKEHILGDTSAQIKVSEVECILDELFGVSKPKKKSVSAKRRTAGRKYLVPSGSSVDVKHDRVRDIYFELRDDVQVNEAPNAVAALFRIFMELSLDYYIKKKDIALNEKGKVSIKQKIKAVSDYMEEEGVIDAIDLKNIRRVASEKNSYLGVEVFHEYMHSLETKPEPLDLKTKWDNLEGFFETLWSDVS